MMNQAMKHFPHVLYQKCLGREVITFPHSFKAEFSVFPRPTICLCVYCYASAPLLGHFYLSMRVLLRFCPLLGLRAVEF